MPIKARDLQLSGLIPYLMHMRYMILILSVSLFTISCSKKDAGSGGPNTDSLPAVSYLDQSYGNTSAQKMDIYLPELRNSTTRTVFIIHGGGWVEGDKSEFTGYITEFQKRLPGYAFANLNYSLATATTNHFPAQEEDIMSAIQFYMNKSGDYHVSKDYIFLGISAGAHLALLQGYKHNDIVQPKGIVSFFGPTDLNQLYLHSSPNIRLVLNTITNATPEENPELFTESSPINYVTGDDAPTLMLHGDADDLIPVEQAQLLHHKLDLAGVSNTLVVYPGQGHGWFGDDLTDSFNKVEAFIKGLAN